MEYTHAFWLIIQLLTLGAIHFVADFICQTDWQANNKSSNNWALSSHVLTYFFTFLIVGLLVIFASSHWREQNVYYIDAWATFCIVNAVIHWVTDYFTSRINKYFWTKGNVHMFFVGVGFDQYICHIPTLFLTYYMIVL